MCDGKFCEWRWSSTDDLVEKLEDHNTNVEDVLKEFAPILTLAGASIAIYKLHQKYQRKEISLKRLSFLIFKMTSLKGAKVLAIIVVLNIPLVGPAYGAKLVGSLLFKFRDFMKKALSNKGSTPFRIPEGIVLVRVDPSSGLVSSLGSRNFILEAFKPGTAPSKRSKVIGAGYDASFQENSGDRPSAGGLY